MIEPPGLNAAVAAKAAVTVLFKACRAQWGAPG